MKQRCVLTLDVEVRHAKRSGQGAGVQLDAPDVVVGGLIFGVDESASASMVARCSRPSAACAGAPSSSRARVCGWTGRSVRYPNGRDQQHAAISQYVSWGTAVNLTRTNRQPDDRDAGSHDSSSCWGCQGYCTDADKTTCVSAWMCSKRGWCFRRCCRRSEKRVLQTMLFVSTGTSAQTMFRRWFACSRRCAVAGAAGAPDDVAVVPGAGCSRRCCRLRWRGAQTMF